MFPKTTSSIVIPIWTVCLVKVCAKESLDAGLSAIEEVLGIGVQARWRFPSESKQYCETPVGGVGTCLTLRECPELFRIRDIDILRRFICGFERRKPLLCCPPGQRDVNSTTFLAPKPQRIPAYPRPTAPIGPNIPWPIVTNPQPEQPPQRLKKPSNPKQSETLTTRTTSTATTSKPKLNLPVTGYNKRPLKPDFLPSVCGFSNVSLSRVVGGSDTEPGAWPWMAAIYVRNGENFIHACGGALVSYRHVVTAAHCVGNGKRPQTLPPSLLVVRLGDHNLAEVSDLPLGVTVDVSVEKIKRHSAFNPRSYLNDIGLLYLAAEVPFSRYIQPVCLPYNAVPDDIAGQHGFVTGWGYTKYEGKRSTVLKQALLKIWSENECAKAFQKEVIITQEYLCAGDGQGLRDSCQGDSGGPLVFFEEDRFYLIGIVSFGKRCATPGYPGVYTRVTQYLQWLRENF